MKFYTHEAIEVAISWTTCEDLGISDALEPELQLAVSARIEEKYNLIDKAQTAFSQWDSIEVWNADGDKIEPPEGLVKDIHKIIADEAKRLTA